MATKNIFAGTGTKTTFVNIIYGELMKREFVTLADILCIYHKREKGYYEKMSCCSETGYGELKKAFPEVVKELRNVYPESVEDNGKIGKGRAYRYVGKDDDPLAEERKAVEQKRLEDYVAFCKASAGIMPASWFSSFFENTQLLLDTNRESKDGEVRICSGLEQNLTNIDLLPVFYKAIANKQVLRFDYQRFGYNVPLDRIVGEVSEVNDVEYIPAPKCFYQEFFNNIIGVTHEKGAKVEEVIIRTKTEYQHGLLLTKPLHHSQKETMPFGEHEDGNYGEVQLTVESNRELRGRILLYGENLEVISPLSLREQIKEILRRQMQQYSENK